LLPGVGVGVDCGLGVDVLHVELSVPGPHPDVGGGVDVGAMAWGVGVVLHVELSVPGPHPGPASAFGGGGGGVPVLLFVGAAIVAFPSGVAAPCPILPLNVEGSGQALVGIHVSLPPGSPGSQGIQLVLADRTQYPVGE
jgi:hypothetical protein